MIMSNDNIKIVPLLQYITYLFYLFFLYNVILKMVIYSGCYGTFEAIVCDENVNIEIIPLLLSDIKSEPLFNPVTSMIHNFFIY